MLMRRREKSRNDFKIGTSMGRRPRDSTASMAAKGLQIDYEIKQAFQNKILGSFYFNLLSWPERLP